MWIALAIGAAATYPVARIGRLGSGQMWVACAIGAVNYAALLWIPTWFFMPPPSTPTGQGIVDLLQLLVELQWVAWWMIAGSLIPLTLTFILGLTRSLSPAVIGACTGLGVGLLWLSWLNYSPAPAFTGSLWRVGLALQGVLCLCCALATAGVPRIRSKEAPLPA